MPTSRSWMDNRVAPGRRAITEEFIMGVGEFIDFALQHPQLMDGDKIRCPCSDCRNRKFFLPTTIRHHLCNRGFVRDYKRWTRHGESLEDRRTNLSNSSTAESTAFNVEPMMENEYATACDNMVMAAAGTNFDWSSEREEQEEQPNREAEKFFELKKAAHEPLWPGCKTHTKLSAISQLLNIKADSNMSESDYDRFMKIVGSFLPEEHKLADSFYSTKKMVTKLGLGLQKIDACENGCMLYYKENLDKRVCNVCGHSRYKPRRRGSSKHKEIPHKVLRYMPLTPRLQRLYMSKATAENMRWHKECPREEGLLSHPSDGEAWKLFDQTHPTFSSEPRNVRLGFSTDGFNPFNHSAQPYSCWPVIVTPYNLPPWMCMNEPYMFLTLLIPGPKGPGKSLDVYLEPLIDELKDLWNIGVQTYDVSRKQNFQMKAALMWTIGDFPAYGMMSGWSTHGKLSCPYCMEDTKTFTLESGGKSCFFDCHRRFLPKDHPYRRQRDKFTKGRIEEEEPPLHLTSEQIWGRVLSLPQIKFGRKSGKQKIRGFGNSHNWVKRSIFWDLPYWKTNLLRHNLDVMHIEKNVFDNIFNTIMDVKGKSKDNIKARIDLKTYCKRGHLELTEVNGKTFKPKAPYSLTKEEQMIVLTWIQQLRLPDGYASNLGRCVNLEDCKMYGMKSHDCHVFMERLLSIAFRDLLPEPIWNALTELSQFFRDICSTVLREEDMKRLEKNIVVTICKLEQIFPPAFFDSMEHLPIHLPYEARVGGPVQYRWMYPFERYMNHLKKKVKNKARVEGSICEAYVIQETSTFCCHFFEPSINTKFTRVGRNDNDNCEAEHEERISVFKHSGRGFGELDPRWLNSQEMSAATVYVLLNCMEVAKYVTIYEAGLSVTHPDLTPEEIGSKRDREFSSWFKDYVNDPSNDVSDRSRLQALARGPSKKVKRWNGYFVNGYRFHTQDYGSTKSTMNSGVFIKGSYYHESECIDYYGLLEEVIELRYLADDLSDDKLVMFKCLWYDSGPRGTKVHPTFKIVDVNHSRSMAADNPFVMASQAHQVYYSPYPYRRRRVDRDWWAVCKTKARSTFNISYTDIPIDIEPPEEDGFYQEDEMATPPIVEVDSDDNVFDNVFAPHGESAQYEEVDQSDLPRTTNQFEVERQDDNSEEGTEDEEEFESDTSEDEEDELEFDDISSGEE